jgi:ABC-type glycerol-3-phosphate transport system substrate-binding protein
MAKRVLILGLALLVMASFAWANGQGEGAKKRIVHYHWTETSYDKINNHAVELFQAKHPNVEVKMLLLPDADRAAKIRTTLAANGEIDSFALSNGESAEFLGTGQMVPLDPKGFGKKTVEEVVAMWNPGAIETSGGTWEGKYYGIPFELSNYVAWINVADMKEAGLNPATDKPKTWDAFTVAAKKMVKEEGGARVRNGFMANPKDGIFSFLIMSTIMEQLGLDWGTEKGLVASMDQTAKLVRGIQTYTDMVVKDKIWDPGMGGEDRQGFATNKTATFLTGGSWYWGVLDTGSVPRKDVEPMNYPRFADGKDIGGVGYGYCVYVSKLAKDKTLTFEWLDSLASQPNEFIKLGYNQPRKTLSDGTPALDASLAKASIPYYDEVFKGELQKTAVWLSSTKGKEVSDANWAAISRVIYQNGKVDESVAQLEKDIKAIYAK